MIFRVDMISINVSLFLDSEVFAIHRMPQILLVLVHYSSIQNNEFKSLAEGESISFDIESGPKGPKAINVVKI